MIRLEHETGHAVSVFFNERLLCRYVYVPDGTATEAPRPYVHPVNSMKGDTLTNFRPNDHPWHHGLSLTLNDVSGANFWGGPTFSTGTGYRFQENHGAQHHTTWTQLDSAAATATLAHVVEWRYAQDVLLQEERSLRIQVDEGGQGWALHWKSRLKNVSGRMLSLGNPQSNSGLEGSHYTGLQFRGARALLDDHHDSAITVMADGGLDGVNAVHGSSARWMEWHGQSDTSLNRVRIRFENNTGPLHWFVRRPLPLAAFPVQFDRKLDLHRDAELELDYTLTFTSP